MYETPKKGDPLTDPVARSIRREQMQNAMPAMIECDDCGTTYADDWPDCPKCNDLEPTREELGL